jgi:HK97 family phage prohead protease
MERKLASVDTIELKFDEARKGFFSGYASKFNGVDSYGDTIIPGAYKKTLKKRTRPIALRWNHYGPVIGKWTEMREDEAGLYVEGELTPGHSAAEDAYALLKHGAVTGLSIGFRPIKVHDRGDGTRDLKEIELVEISIVETPADLGAMIGDVKSAIDEIESLKQAEAFLRDGFGLSWTSATALVSQIKSVALRDGDAEAKRLAEQVAAAFQRFPG